MLQEQVEKELRSSLAKNGITVTAFNIESIDFEDAFEQAVRLKVEAEQQALRAQNETALKEEEAKQRVIAAEAEAESQKIAAEAEAYAIELIQKQLSSSPQYIQLQMVEKVERRMARGHGQHRQSLCELEYSGVILYT